MPNEADRYVSGHDFLVINGPIDEVLFPKVYGCVSRGKKNKNLVVAVVTYGGIANPAYRISRYLQSIYDDITAFIPAACKSAGTLLVTGANRISLSPFGELGPLDVQLRQKDEIFGRRSGLITRAAISDLKDHAFELFEHFMLQIIAASGAGISFRTAADVSAKVTSEIMSSVYEQISPDSLGQDFRDLSVATQYCERLNKWSKNLVSGSVARLVHQYPSHDFVIDYEEAKEIFVNVELPTPTIWKFMRRDLDAMVMPRESGQHFVDFLTLPSEEGAGHETANAAEGEGNASHGTSRRRGNGAGAATSP